MRGGPCDLDGVGRGLSVVPLPYPMKPTTLLLLLVTMLVGCNSLGYDDYRRSRRADSRGYNNRTAAERAYPNGARVNDRGRTAYVLCHKNRSSKTVRTPAVRGHLNHGDTFGSCRSDRRARQDRRGRRGYDRNDRRRDRREDRRRDRRHDDDDD